MKNSGRVKSSKNILGENTITSPVHVSHYLTLHRRDSITGHEIYEKYILNMLAALSGDEAGNLVVDNPVPLHYLHTY